MSTHNLTAPELCACEHHVYDLLSVRPVHYCDVQCHSCYGNTGSSLNTDLNQVSNGPCCACASEQW